MESVLGDRCIQLILEKSDRDVVTNLIEIYREDEIVQNTVKMLNQCSLCSFSFSTEVYRKWNSYVKSNYTKYTNYTNNTNYTNYTHTFKLIKNMALNGRELELSLPLCLVANEISDDLLKETTLTLKKIFQAKKEEEVTDNIDVSLYDFISQEPESSDYGEWESINEITKNFIDFLQTSEDWINSKWMGRALKRLGLIKEKKRIGRGVSIILDIPKAKQKIKMFK